MCLHSEIKICRGDHYATLVVKVPEKLNNEQKEALRQFDAAMRGESVTKPAEEGHGEGKKKSFMEKVKEAFEDKE